MSIRAVVTLAVTAVVLAGSACAQPLYKDRAGDKLGELTAPPGGKAYRSTWSAPMYDGFIEVAVGADGTPRLRTSWHTEPVVLQPGDLAGFEAELARSAFAIKTTDGECMCVDECADFFLTVAQANQRKRLHVCSNALTWTVNELSQLADLRAGGQPFAAPAPWWVRDGLERPDPSLPGPRALMCPEVDGVCARSEWLWLRVGLGLKVLTATYGDLAERTYRLVAIPGDGAPEAITLTVFDDPQKPNCRAPYVLSCPAMMDAARLAIGSHAPHRISLKRALAFEEKLFAAGLSTLPVTPPDRCASGEGWVLEAQVAERYRAVTATTCDPRGLAPAVEDLRHLAGR